MEGDWVAFCGVLIVVLTENFSPICPVSWTDGFKNFHS